MIGNKHAYMIFGCAHTAPGQLLVPIMTVPDLIGSYQALVIIALIPLALRGVAYRPSSARS